MRTSSMLTRQISFGARRLWRAQTNPYPVPNLVRAPGSSPDPDGIGTGVIGTAITPQASCHRRHSTWAIISTSTVAPRGKATAPTAARACRPRSPKMSCKSSLAPLATWG